MKAVERIIIKMVVIHFVFLVVVQILFHQFNLFPELKEITQYEGVTENNFTELLEVFNSK